MKILETQSARLTNFEVLARIQEYEAEHSGADKSHRQRPMPKNLEQIVKDVKAHLLHSSSPLSPANQSDDTQLRASTTTNGNGNSNSNNTTDHQSQPGTLYSSTATQTLASRLDGKYAFLTSEYLMFFNLRPKNVAELSTVVEDIDKRFTEEEQMDVLEIIKEVLGGPAEVLEDEEMGEEEEQ